MPEYKIYIDTTERYLRKIHLLSRAGKIVDKIEGDIDISAELRNLVTRNNINLRDIYEFSSNPGPGSFTGIKIGITVANVLSWALNDKKINELQIPEYGKEPNITPPKR